MGPSEGREKIAHFSRIEEIQRVDCLFDRAHELYGSLSKFLDEVFLLAYSNTVLSGTRSIEGYCSMNHPVHSAPDFLQLFVISEE